jgi:hypothetical protein
VNNFDSKTTSAEKKSVKKYGTFKSDQEVSAIFAPNTKSPIIIVSKERDTSFDSDIGPDGVVFVNASDALLASKEGGSLFVTIAILHETVNYGQNKHNRKMYRSKQWDEAAHYGFNEERTGIKANLRFWISQEKFAENFLQIKSRRNCNYFDQVKFNPMHY